jgi:hypothetical protein
MASTQSAAVVHVAEPASVRPASVRGARESPVHPTVVRSVAASRNGETTRSDAMRKYMASSVRGVRKDGKALSP